MQSGLCPARSLRLLACQPQLQTDTMACLYFEDPDERRRASATAHSVAQTGGLSAYISTEVFNTGGLMPFMSEAADRLATLVGSLTAPKSGKVLHLSGPALARAITAATINVLFNSARPLSVKPAAASRRSVPQFR